jgi:RNA polymerase sigma factor (sigma-70 family)
MKVIHSFSDGIWKNVVYLYRKTRVFCGISYPPASFSQQIVMKLFIRGNTAEVSDAELILRYKQSGDKFFVGELFKRYSHLVFGLCLNYYKDKDESKDAVMRIFEKLFEELKKREVENFKGWICFVSRNFCISELRRKKTRLGKEEEIDWQEKEEGPEQKLTEAEDAREKEIHLEGLAEAVTALKEEQRICVELFYIKEKSYKEIMEITSFSEKEVKSFIQNGKRNLKILLSNSNEYVPR